jgi:hypothetical protein
VAAFIEHYNRIARNGTLARLTLKLILTSIEHGPHLGKAQSVQMVAPVAPITFAVRVTPFPQEMNRTSAPRQRVSS